jgi:CRISPR-associated protein Cas2
MDILVTYDVNTLTKEGRRRLRKAAKICTGYGQRVQESVFECSVNDAQREKLIARLTDLIDADEDSLRVYTLRGGREGAVECYGRNLYVNFRDPLLV